MVQYGAKLHNAVTQSVLLSFFMLQHTKLACLGGNIVHMLVAAQGEGAHGTHGEPAALASCTEARAPQHTPPYPRMYGPRAACSLGICFTSLWQRVRRLQPLGRVCCAAVVSTRARGDPGQQPGQQLRHRRLTPCTGQPAGHTALWRLYNHSDLLLVSHAAASSSVPVAVAPTQL